ncbi:hypothetical protein E2C01_069358 [Portunus trituberculatus]|uniref:Uncharacterized protein n=1 Tax=Portunus trituberculatus TaxID=210409 RepID=A0A5B7HZ55_PORTR|nr:hypothetical protein [Portunus trituberculatus]
MNVETLKLRCVGEDLALGALGGVVAVAVIVVVAVVGETEERQIRTEPSYVDGAWRRILKERVK